MAIHSNGQVYFASQCSVFLFSSDGKTETRIAGSTDNLCGYAEGTGTAAQFNEISGLALSPAGDTLYIADFYNNCVRKMDVVTKEVVTVAGECGSSGGASTGDVTLYRPIALAVSTSGSVFIVDTDSSQTGRLHRVDVVYSAVSTVFGASNDKSFSGVVVSSDGWLYLADRFAIYRFLHDETPKALSAVAGLSSAQGTQNGAANDVRFQDMSGLALDSAGANVLIVDAGSRKIRRLNLATMTVDDVVGAGTKGNVDGPALSATFDTLYGVASDSAGNVYIADYDNKVRKLTASQGVVSTLFGASDLTVYAVAVAPTGEVYFATYSAIYLIASDEASYQVIAGSPSDRGADDGEGTDARFDRIRAIAFSPSGADLFIAVDHCIRKLNMESKAVTTVAGVCDVEGYRDGDRASALFSSPTSIAVSSTGMLFVGEYYAGRFRRVFLGV